jgi:hypothetical protein
MNGRAMKPRIAASIARNPTSLLIISDDFFKSANNTFKKGPITRSMPSGRWKISECSISLLIVKTPLHTLLFLVPALAAHALSVAGPQAGRRPLCWRSDIAGVHASADHNRRSTYDDGSLGWDEASPTFAGRTYHGFRTEEPALPSAAFSKQRIDASAWRTKGNGRRDHKTKASGGARWTVDPDVVKRAARRQFGFAYLLPKPELEPRPSCEDRILNPARLPSPSHRKQIAVMLKVCESEAPTSPPW